MSTSQRWVRRLVSAGIGTAALLMVGGIAYAAWSALGVGTSVTVQSLTLAGAVTASAGCSTPGVTVSLPASTTLVVPAGGNASLTVANGIAMTTASSSNCQGATFTIPLQATGRLS